MPKATRRSPTAAVDAGGYDPDRDRRPGRLQRLRLDLRERRRDTVTVTDGIVTIALGADLTCTITNTDNPGEYVLVKSSDPASGATVNPGDTVTYTLTVNNDSDGFVSGATVTDDLSDVLDNAALARSTGGSAISPARR